ncbi:LamB/YcsF family protein, partial [Pseudomonas viridiflava]|uniref:LamB/YcsF family protein n=2 Tax=Pseudomonas TaxID=286 RepID=UPI00197F1631
PVQAAAVIQAILRIDPQLKLVCLANSKLLGWARDAGLTCVSEAFADRAYTAQGTLVSRSHPGAVLHDVELITERMLRLVRDGVIEAEDGSLIELEADSICVHGDSPGAVNIAHALKQRLLEAGVNIRAFTRGQP